MIDSSDFRTKRVPLNHGAGHMPVLGFGTLIPDAAGTISATRDALEARHFDCAERALRPMIGVPQLCGNKDVFPRSERA
jgi:hypothetical protein